MPTSTLKYVSFYNLKQRQKVFHSEDFTPRMEEQQISARPFIGNFQFIKSARFVDFQRSLRDCPLGLH